ncbi:hypothetical protein [Abyssisolibacter fermentans]|uniref:hypothetical protein n=1 Tax=Abyssisolibacter fermentans TaxID=1766203 RepID=UPI0012E36C87|nr:hypothetical protein [Abyssisolibacter fermentans]
MMYELGIVLILIGGIIVFGADKLYKKGKIKDMKHLLILKSSGLGLTILALLLLIKFK